MRIISKFTEKFINRLIPALILIAVTGLVCGCTSFSDLGRQNLYSRAQTEAPVLPEETEEASSGEEDAENQDAEQADGEKEDNIVHPVSWQKGWVRYNGKIYEYNPSIISILYMGIDKTGRVQLSKDGISGGQADALFLFVLNPDKKTASVVAINRNTITDVDVFNESGEYVGTQKLQICLQHGYGDGMELSCERQVKAVSGLFFGLPIHGYIATNQDAAAALNDAVGGVTLEVLEDIPAWKGIRGFTKGEVTTLSGQEARRYVQYRDVNVFDSASGRLLREKQYLNAIFSRMKEVVKENPSSIMNIYQAVSPYTVTNMEPADLLYLAGQAPSYSMGSEGIYSMEGETILAESGFEEFYPDRKQLYDLMINVFYSEVK